uniref:Uncharacterized protein n=1 Tax=Amphora coffeiformis TaxID=265554 RepID=A0A7S3LD14_9STRA
MILRRIVQGCLLCTAAVVSAWTPAQQDASRRRMTESWQKAIGSALLVGLVSANPVYADQIGVEKEAPTLYTGETVEICTKRGPLGACLKTEMRTETNDNDKAKKYFRDPAEILREKNAVLRGSEEEEGNALVEKLKAQTETNKEKNRLAVERRTFENGQSATFGPFDKQVLIMNTDGKTFTLLANPQAMRLKQAGFIGEGRQFVKQPTQEEIDQALEADGEGLAGAIQSILRGNS